MLTRRSVLGAAGAGLALAGSGPKISKSWAAGAPVTPGVPSGVVDSATLEALPGKKPLIRLAYRPPNYEAPLDYFRTPITPNDQFFVRYHLSDIPEVDAKTYKITVGGDGANGQAAFDLDELKRLPAVEVTAVCQCSGNRRGLFHPHVPGVEWGYGAMGCAKWKGARLKDVLDKAGLKKEAVEIVYNGADGPALDKTPDFVKALDIDHASDGEVMLAYGMNGEDLPVLNGFPLRLIVPGYYGTYWVKHLNEITVLDHEFDGFWMKSAYRIPDTPNNSIEPGTTPKATIPIRTNPSGESLGTTVCTWASTMWCRAYAASAFWPNVRNSPRPWPDVSQRRTNRP